MDKETFKANLFHAELMMTLSGNPHYWRGYRRGLHRAFHGESFGTEEEHQLWQSFADWDEPVIADRGLGYLDGLQAK